MCTPQATLTTAMHHQSTGSIGCSHDTLERMRARCAAWGKVLRCIFYLPTCSHCKDALRTWHSDSLADAHDMWVHVKDEAAMRAYGISKVPSVVLFRPGEPPVAASGTADEDDEDDEVDPSDEAPPIIRSTFTSIGAVRALVATGRRCAVLVADAGAYRQVREQWNVAVLCDERRQWAWCVLRGDAGTAATILKITPAGMATYDGAIDGRAICNWFGLGKPDVYSTLVPRADVAGTIAAASQHVPVVVLYYADWCGHCASFKPHWNDAVHADVDASDVQYIALNESSPRAQEMLTRDRVRGFPTVIKHFAGTAQDMATVMPRRDGASLRAFAHAVP